MREVHVVPHTHWDREWYEPFPTFRLRLVDLLDELLDRLEADPSFIHFQLDGQMAVVDDYLEVRPEARDRLVALAGAGRLSMGPWYVLPDEFLVSGETLVRDLQLGLERADAFGGAMEIGYLPDMFGHVAQMPQVLSLFGFRDAVVWRGVPSVVTTPAFWWESPDGTRVRAEYLPAGYGNGSDMPADPAGVRAKIDLFRGLQGSLAGDPLLLMAGMDHEVPPPHLTAVIAALNAEDASRNGDGYHLRIGPLADHLATASSDDLTVVRGELRSGARANVLMGVTSNRVDVKQAAARAERLLERRAEPLAALWLDRPDRWRPLLAAAWLEVIRNAAHDSICACSHDEVVDAVLHRYAEAARTAEGVAERAVDVAVAEMAEPGAVLLNPLAVSHRDVIELTVPGPRVGGQDGDVRVQVLEEWPEVEELITVDAADAPLVLLTTMLSDHPGTRAVRVEDDADEQGPVLVVHLLPEHGADTVGRDDGVAELGLRCGEDPSLRVRLVLHRAEPVRRVLTLAGPVPALGWARWEPVAPEHPVAAHGATGLTNGLVTVEVDPADGTWALDGLAGFGRLVDDGDAGDTYNWCPPEENEVVDRPADVSVEVTEAGPVRGRIVVRATYELPERCDVEGGTRGVSWGATETYRRAGRVAQVLTTTLELRADDPAVRVETAWDQRARDHRLRVHLPLPRRTDRSEAECAYAVVERPLWIEDGTHEWGVPTFPSRRFVRAGGLTVTHEGLCEYELVDLDAEVGYGQEPPAGTTAGALAVTLVRSTGWLSRGPMPSRPMPAGPFDRLEGSQVLRPLRLRYAVQRDHGPGDVDPHVLADRVWNPLELRIAPGGGALPDTGTRLEIGGPEDGSVVVDAVQRDDAGRLVVRAHEPWGREARLSLPGRTGWLVDLRGRELEPFRDDVELGPHRIVTARIDD
jgi:hypothetical protein